MYCAKLSHVVYSVVAPLHSHISGKSVSVIHLSYFTMINFLLIWFVPFVMSVHVPQMDDTR